MKQIVIKTERDEFVCAHLTFHHILRQVPPTAGLSVLLSPELDHLIDLNIEENKRLNETDEVDGEPQDPN